MSRQIFVNLPVRDLKASMAFFEKLGFSFNPQFTDETAACMVISENNNYAMLLTHEKFKEFTPYPISDAQTSTQVLIALDCKSREEVDEMVNAAVAAGGKNYKDAQDLGFMYAHGFQDLDGHIWEVFYMDMSAFPG